MCLQSKLISGSDARHYFVDEKVININVESVYLGNELSAYGNMEMLFSNGKDQLTYFKLLSNIYLLSKLIPCN